MLSRNQIRIKILHCIYSSYIKEDFHNLDYKKSFDEYIKLYEKILEILVYVKSRAEFEINHGLSKNIATKLDLNPNEKFKKNEILQKMKDDTSTEFEDDEKRRIGKKIFNQLQSKNYFQSYMNSNTRTIEEDKKLVKRILKEELFDVPETFDYLESQSIYWNDDLLAAQILISKMIDEYNPDKDKKFSFKKVKVFKNKEDELFAKKLLLKTIKNKTKNTEIIHQLAKNWDIERISMLDSILIQLAITEMTEFDSIPYKVSINEYIEISKTYSTKKSHEFINGILDTFLKKKILI